MEHRLLGLEADPEIAARELLHVERVLRRERLVDAELRAQGGARLLVKLGTRLRFAVASPGSARNSTKLKLAAMKAMTSALPARRRMKRWRLLMVSDAGERLAARARHPVRSARHCTARELNCVLFR